MIDVKAAGFASVLVAASLSSPGALRAKPGVPQVLPIEARWCLAAKSEGAVPPVCITLEVADEHKEQRLGLMHRPPLPARHGMWFDFSRKLPISMWMLNTPSSLDMVFVDEQVVVGIEKSVSFCRSVPCPSYFADRDHDGLPDLVEGVIELRSGEADRLGIEVGDQVVIERLDRVVADPMDR